METAAALVVNAVTIIAETVVVVEVGGWHSIWYVDDVGPASPPQGGLAAG